MTSSRLYTRRLYSRPVGILSGSSYSIEYIIDISEAGMLVRSNRNLAIHEHILVNFYLEGGGYLILPAEVKWTQQSPETNKQFFGVEFLKVAFENRRALRAFIAARPQGEVLQGDRFLTSPNEKQEQKVG